MALKNRRLLETIDLLERRLQDDGGGGGGDDDCADEEELFSPLARILYTQMLGDCYCELRSSAYYPAAALAEFEDRAESAYRSAVNLAAGIALAPTDPLRLLSMLSLCKALVQLRGRRRRARHLALRLYTQATMHSHALSPESARLLQALREDFVPPLSRAEQEDERARREREASAYSSDESSLEDGSRAGDDDDDDSDDEDLFDEDGNRLDPGGRGGDESEKEAGEREEEADREGGEGERGSGGTGLGPQTDEGGAATSTGVAAAASAVAIPAPASAPSSKLRAAKPPPSPSPSSAKLPPPASPSTPARTPSKDKSKSKDKAAKAATPERRGRSPSPGPGKSNARAPATPSASPTKGKSSKSGKGIKGNKATSSSSPQHAGLELNQRPEGLHLLPKRARSAIAIVKGLRGLVTLPAPVLLDGGVASAPELYRALYRIFSVYVRGAGLPGHAAADYKVTVDGQEVAFSAYLLSGPYMSFRGLCVVLRDFAIAKLPNKKKAPGFPAIHDPPGAVREFSSKAAGGQAPLSIREAVLLFIEAARSAQPALTSAAFVPIYAALAAQERASSVSLFKEQIELAFRPDGQATVKTGQSPWDRALAWAAGDEEDWEGISCGLNFMQFLDFLGKAALVAYSAPRFEAAFPTPHKKIEHFLAAHMGLMDSRRWLAKVDSRVNALKYTISGMTAKFLDRQQQP